MTRSEPSSRRRDAMRSASCWGVASMYSGGSEGCQSIVFGRASRQSYELDALVSRKTGRKIGELPRGCSRGGQFRAGLDVPHGDRLPADGLARALDASHDRLLHGAAGHDRRVAVANAEVDDLAHAEGAV